MRTRSIRAERSVSEEGTLLLNKRKLLEGGNASLIWKLRARGGHKLQSSLMGPESAPVKLLEGPLLNPSPRGPSNPSTRRVNADQIALHRVQSCLEILSGSQLILWSACNLIIAVCFLPRASLSHTRVRDVRKIARLSSGSSHKAGFLQFQRGLGGPHLQGSHCIWVLRGERDGVSCVEKGEIATLITLFFFLSFLTC